MIVGQLVSKVGRVDKKVGRVGSGASCPASSDISSQNASFCVKQSFKKNSSLIYISMLWKSHLCL